MKSSFAGRRKARVVGQDAPDEAGRDVNAGGDSSDEHESTPVVRRPNIPSRNASKPAKKSSLRLSFGPGETSTAEDGGSTSEVFTPKRSNLGRQAIEKNALRKSLAPLSSEHLPLRQTYERPSYSADALSELKNSTPSTPKDLHSLSDVESSTEKALDIASKFGSDLALHQNASIPTESEIREKKERRARLAKEQDFIHLYDSDSNREISLLPQKHKAESRLVREDEDLLENFDDFVSDGKISLGKKAERAQARQHKLQMQELINEAEGSSASSDDDDSEKERHAAYEAAQTRKGMDGLHKSDEHKPRRPKTPPRITPLPHLSACLDRLQTTLRKMEEGRAQKAKTLDGLQREKADITAREAEIQRLLEEAGHNYERLRAEAAISGMRGKESEGPSTPRGLESLGHTPVPGTPS